MKELLKNPKVPYIFSIILIFGAVFLLFHELFFGKIISTNDLNTNDLLYFNYPIRVLYSVALKHGQLLQWTPLIYGGFPVFAEGQGGFLYPLNLIIWYLFNSVTALNLYIIFHAMFMGFGIYLLVTKLTGNKILSIPSGAAAAICGSIIAGHTRHLNSMTAITFIPWLLYSIELYLRSKKMSRGLLFGLLVGIMYLSGHPQYSFIAGFYAILYLLLRLRFDPDKKESFIKRFKSYKVVYFLLISIVVSVVIIFPQLKSTLELLPLTERSQELGSEFTGHGSMPLQGFLTFFYPYYLGNAGDLTFKLVNNIYFFWEFFHYTGALIFLLSIYGTIKMWRREEYRSFIHVFVIIALLGYILATGENLQLYKIFTLFPITKSFRYPVRWLVGSEISILILSGFGMIALAELIFRKANILEKTEKKGESYSNINTSSNHPKLYYVYALVFSVTLMCTLDIYIVAGKQVATADSNIYLTPPSYVDKIKDDNSNNTVGRFFALSRGELLSSIYIKSQGWEGSQDFYELGQKSLPEELGVIFGVPYINGYFLLVPGYIYSIWGDNDQQGVVSKTVSFNENKTNIRLSDKFARLSKLFGVKFFNSIWYIPKPYEKIWDTLGVRTYELQDTMSRCWVVSKVESFSSSSNKINAETLISDNFDPWKSAYVDGTSPSLPAESQNGTAEVMKYENQSVTIKANVPGLVVLNDTWYPRWKAYIDGKEIHVYKTNVMMRGVVAPKAGSIIEMKFDDGNVFIFALISYFTIFISCAYLIWEKVKKVKNLQS